MKAKRIWSLLAGSVLVATTAMPCVAQEKTTDSASSNQSQNAAEAKRKAKVKQANRRFNRRYGKKVPRPKATKIRIDETRNQVRVFNKEAATSKTTASTATKTRPKTVAGQGQTTEANSRTKASSSTKTRVAKKGAENKKVLKQGNRAADRRLQENLRRNEDIRHKGDEARVKRNLAKLKNKMKPDEIARAKETLKAANSREGAKAARAAEAAKAAKAAEAAKAARAAEAAKAAKAAEAARAAKAAEAAKAARASEAARAAKAAEAAKAARAAEAARATKAAQAAKAARAAQAVRAAKTARALQAARAAAAGRGAVTAARAATASTGVGVAVVAGSIVAEQIVMQEIEHPGKTARDIGGFFTGLVGTAVVSKPDTAAPNSAIHDTFRIETGKAVVRAAPNGRSGYTKIQFATNLDWWTAIVIRDISGNVIEVAKSGGRHHILVNQKIYGRTNTIEIRSNVLPAQVSIEFWTAKTFGVHKQLVIMKYRRERLDGRTVGITWNK